MGKRSKYTYEQKLHACIDYLSGKKSYREIAVELCMGKSGHSTVMEWVGLYQAHGSKALQDQKSNASYSKAFKTKVVEEYLMNSSSFRDLQCKYGIRSKSEIQDWIIKYNSNKELKEYDPHPEVFMTERRKTTLQEREEIVQYCLSHDRNYKETALKYDCNYSQVYNWVRNYDRKGTDGLQDNRGRHKTEEELTELEKAQRRIKELENQLLLKERENELLKKVEEFERRW